MPLYRFTGPTAWVYPETKDESGRNLGIVEPGDVRPFAEAPDHMWMPAPDGSGEARPEPASEPAPAPEPEAEPEAEAEPAPDGPQPDPSAYIPGA